MTLWVWTNCGAHQLPRGNWWKRQRDSRHVRLGFSQRVVFVGKKINSHQQNVLRFVGTLEVEWVGFHEVEVIQMVGNSEFEPKEKRTGKTTMEG